MRNPDEIKSNQILFFGKPLMFFVKNEDISYLPLDDVLVEKTDCGYQFAIQRDSTEIIGMMIPTVSSKILIDQKAVDPNRTKRYYYQHDGNYFLQLYGFGKFDVDRIATPLVHFVKDGKTYSWSSPPECVISSFQHLYEPHINIETAASNEATFFLDVSSSHIVNQQRYKVERKEVLINEYSDVVHLKESLLYGHVPREVPNSPSDIMKTVRELQSSLTSQEVDSVITGSLARRLNNIAIDVHDIDLMVSTPDDVTKATSILDSSCDRVYIKDHRSKFMHNDLEIDVCFDNYNLLPASNFLVNRMELKFLSLEGLMWLYLMDLFAISRNEYTETYKDHVMRALYSISKGMPGRDIGIIPDIENMECYSQGFLEILQEMKDFTQEYRDVRISPPFDTRIYRKDNLFMLPVINQGSVNDVRIIVDFLPKKSEWTDVSGKKEIVEQELRENFVILHLKQIHLPGVIRCQSKED